jgi:hypothetical protein
MYVMAANDTSIKVVALNAPGDAQPIQSLDLAGPANVVGLALSTFYG